MPDKSSDTDFIAPHNTEILDKHTKAPPSVSSRFGSYREVIWKWAAVVIAGAFSILSILTWLRDEIWAPTNVEPYRVIRFIPHWPWYTWCIAALLSLLFVALEGSHRAIRRREKAYCELWENVKVLTSSSPTFEINVKKILAYKILASCAGNNCKYDIFLRVRLELKYPRLLAISAYTFRLLLQGWPSVAPEQDDLKDWQLVVTTPTSDGARIEALPLATLPRQFELNKPAEGWVHFVTEGIAENFLHQSGIRFSVETVRGDAYKEGPPELTYWEPDPKQKIMRRT